MQLPTEFEAFDMGMEGRADPSAAAGPKFSDRMSRDWMIALGVALLVDRFGLLPTRKTNARGRSSARRSASSIIAEAFGSIGEKRP